MTDAPTNAGTNVNQTMHLSHHNRYTKYLVFWLAKMTLCIMRLCNFPPFLRPNIISNDPTNGLSIHQFHNTLKAMPKITTISAGKHFTKHSVLKCYYLESKILVVLFKYNHRYTFCCCIKNHSIQGLINVGYNVLWNNLHTWAHNFVVRRQWTCPWPLKFMDFQFKAKNSFHFNILLGP